MEVGMPRIELPFEVCLSAGVTEYVNQEVVDKIGEAPVLKQAQVPMIPTVQKQVEMPQIEYVKKARCFRWCHWVCQGAGGRGPVG